MRKTELMIPSKKDQRLLLMQASVGIVWAQGNSHILWFFLLWKKGEEGNTNNKTMFFFPKRSYQSSFLTSCAYPFLVKSLSPSPRLIMSTSCHAWFSAHLKALLCLNAEGSVVMSLMSVLYLIQECFDFNGTTIMAIFCPLLCLVLE